MGFSFPEPQPRQVRGRALGAETIGREGQTARVLTLAQLERTAVDMFTTVYIGNAATKQLGGRMVTPRGYRR